MILPITYVVGITAEAMTAALSAGRQRFDLFGVMVLACVTAFGGGVVRDLLLDHYPLIWVANPIYLVIVLVASLVTVSLSFLMKYFATVFLVADAVGLCTFSVLGTRIAVELGHGFWIATVASVATGAFGGVLRDLFSDRVPLVFQKDLYASICVGITALYLALDQTGLAEDWIIVICLIAGIATRLLAIRYGIALRVFEYLGEDQQMDPRLRRGAQRVRRSASKFRRGASRVKRKASSVRQRMPKPKRRPPE
ncbi:trimeric intracellular cation channel family protein [Corynebacterium atypicum]|uniref:trimeric intracellular cation channel family protein n=1 Tax=Corynebacterium atypicum TaxID=191610 RepID=UPI000A078478|nr:trimeric intracellular cation channel family protein [Corynebacterium atypicum]